MKAIIVGGGLISNAHVVAYKEKGVEIVAIVDPVKEKREEAMKQYGIKKGYETIAEALELKPDIASLCTPNHLHMPHAVQLLKAGVHVITEKPMARTVEECNKMIEAAEMSGKKLFVAHSKRFFPPHQRLIETIKKGALGKTVMVLSTFIGNEYARMNNPKNWKGDYEHSGGGVLIDNGSHMINMLLAALGPVEYVEAVGGKALIEPEHKAEDTAIVNMKFQNGTFGSLTVTFVAQANTFPEGYCGAGIRTEIIGEKGALCAGNGDQVFKFVENDGRVREAYKAISDVPVEYVSDPIEHFIDCLENGTEPLVTMYDGRDTLAVIEAAYQSIKEEKRIYL